MVNSFLQYLNTVPPLKSNVTTSDTNGQAIKSIISLFGKLSSMQQEQLLSRLLHKYMGSMSSTISSVFFPFDTIGTIASAMKNLADNDKPNLIYHLGKCLEPGKEGQSRLPMDRMPYGLLSHNIMFFSSEDVTNLHPEPHFVEWEISMFSHFGHKWAALQRGPMWSECDTKELPTVEVNIPETEEIVSTKKLPGEIQISHGELQTLPKEIQISCEDESCPNQGENNIIQQALAGIFDDDVAGEDLQSSIISEGIIPITDKEVTVSPLYDNDSNESQCESKPLSSLWSNLTDETIEDISQSSLSIDDLTSLHGLDGTSACKSKPPKRDPTKARVSVAGLSVRQLQRRIKKHWIYKELCDTAESTFSCKTKSLGWQVVDKG